MEHLFKGRTVCERANYLFWFLMARQSTEKYPGQRKKEKRDLFRPFRLRVIEDLYRRRFFESFGNCCFKCGMPEKVTQEIGAPPNLCIDHHIPMALGGHLVAGNLVALCRACNGVKLDQHPAEFYTLEELGRLQPLLASQCLLFQFSFDWNRWGEDRERYLLDIGVEPDTIYLAMHDENFVGYLGAGSEQ